MSGVRLQDHVPCAVVAKRCGLRRISDVLRTRRLRWYGHVMRREDGEALASVRYWTVDGRMLRGRPQKTWMDKVKGDMRVLNITDETARYRK